MVKIPDDPDAARALQDNYSAIAIFAAALCGGCLGFLRYNRYPAKVFMGDTGSMFIGGAVVGMAMLLRTAVPAAADWLHLLHVQRERHFAALLLQGDP